MSEQLFQREESFVGRLRARGFVQQCTDEEALDEILATRSATLYCGFDPTADSLHVGHLVPLFLLAHFARAGHHVVALIGGATAEIGDPSGRTEMRKMLSVEEIDAQAERIGAQVNAFLQSANVEGATVVNNAEWLRGLNYIEFLRDIGRHFSVNRMLSFETYKARLETGLSFLEFNYQLLQSYDFLKLFQRYGCILQVGGDDQWGNIVAGADLIRRIEGADAYGLTVPLVTRADGKKMGKSEEGAVFLDSSRTSVYDFYQYWRNVPDEDVGRFLRLYTFLPEEEIASLAAFQDREINRAKERLAWEITHLIHGEAEANRVQEAARAAFAQGTGTEGLPSTRMKPDAIAEGIEIVDLLVRTGLCGSRGEAKRLIRQGGARINERQIRSLEETVRADDFREGELMLRAGKKRYHRVVLGE